MVVRLLVGKNGATRIDKRDRDIKPSPGWRIIMTLADNATLHNVARLSVQSHASDLIDHVVYKEISNTKRLRTRIRAAVYMAYKFGYVFHTCMSRHELRKFIDPEVKDAQLGKAFGTDIFLACH